MYYTCDKANEFTKDKNRIWSSPGFKQNDEHPVVCVSWNDAQHFIEWLSNKDGEHYQLPSEAQWEYAARAGTLTPFAFGECLETKDANFWGAHPLHEKCPKSDVYLKRTVPADRLGKNSWGRYNMHGNVFEWCNDLYGEYDKKYIKEQRNIDPVGGKYGEHRIFRGGSWLNPASLSRSAQRDHNTPDFVNDTIGFRLARIVL